MCLPWGLYGRKLVINLQRHLNLQIANDMVYEPFKRPMYCPLKHLSTVAGIMGGQMLAILIF